MLKIVSIPAPETSNDESATTKAQYKLEVQEQEREAQEEILKHSILPHTYELILKLGEILTSHNSLAMARLRKKYATEKQSGRLQTISELTLEYVELCKIILKKKSINEEDKRKKIRILNHLTYNAPYNWFAELLEDNSV